jgi:hypothetical protein
VEPVDAGLRGKLRRLRGRPVPADPSLVGSISVADMDTFRSAVKHVAIPDEVFDALGEFEDVLEASRIEVTDRRRTAAADWVAARALLNGRDTASVHDVVVLRWTHWSTFDQIEKVETALDQFRDPVIAVAASTRDSVITRMGELVRFVCNVRENGSEKSKAEVRDEIVELAGKVKQFMVGQVEMLDGLRQSASDERVIERVLDDIDAHYRRVKRFLQSPDAKPPTV